MRQLLNFTLVVFALFVCVTVAKAAQTANYPEVMFILDASGSMWGKVGDETKIDAAKKVLHQVVPSLPQEVRVGLTVYGNHRKGDCSDIQVIVPPGSTDRKALLAKSDAVSPMGMTPIADSIARVVELLRTKESETTIVLISDGKETCRDKPCEAVEKLKKSGIRFILHVVGFDVNAKEKAQLECLAKAGGGRYFDADSGSRLLTALETVKEEMIQKVEVEKAKTVQKKATTMLGRLHITMPPDSARCLATIKVTRVKDGQIASTIKHPKADAVYPLLKGRYKIIAGYANANSKPDSEAPIGEVEIKGWETTNLAFGALAINVAEQLKKMPVDAVIIASEEDHDFQFKTFGAANNFYFFKTKPLPPGKYSFALTYGTYIRPIIKEPITWAREISVEAGKTSTINLDSGIRIKKPQHAKITEWKLIPENGSKPFLKITAPWDNDYPVWASYAVPPGIYDLVVSIKGMAEPLPLAQGLAINKGQFVEFDTGL